MEIYLLTKGTGKRYEVIAVCSSIETAKAIVGSLHKNGKVLSEKWAIDNGVHCGRIKHLSFRVLGEERVTDYFYIRLIDLNKKLTIENMCPIQWDGE